MEITSEKISSKRGFALITVLAMSFILLAFGSILMQEAYSHMNHAFRYGCSAEALTIAEYGINRAVYELEQDMNWSGITDEDFAGGKVTVEVSNNFDNPHPSGDVPANSLLVKSTGTVAGGKFEKTVISVLRYQLIPYTAISDGRIVIGGSSDFEFNVNALPGYVSNLHSNYDSTVSEYDSAMPDAFDLTSSAVINADGAFLSTSGTLSASFATEFTGSGGTVNITPQKEFPELSYSDLKPPPGDLIRLDHKAMGGVAFLGKLKNDGGVLKAYYSIPFLGDIWIPVVSPTYGDFMPDGMNWNGATGTITVSGDKNYYWVGDLELENINVEVDTDCQASVFVDGEMTMINMTFMSSNFTVASQNGMNVVDCNFQVDTGYNEEGVIFFTEGDYKVTTPSSTTLPGGNFFRGTVYIKDGAYIFNNECTDPSSDNAMTLEGILIVEGNANGEGIIINNNGSSNFKFTLKYNPHLVSSIYSNVTSDIQLQPVFWDIK